MPMNSLEEPVNRLTSSNTDKVTSTPAYKEASVRMELIDAHGASPLPPGNSRFGHPTPQRGVEVERKWKRSDYSMRPAVWFRSKRNNGRNADGPTDPS